MSINTIRSAVWSWPERKLTIGTPQTRTTNAERIASAVWSYPTRVLGVDYAPFIIKRPHSQTKPLLGTVLNTSHPLSPYLKSFFLLNENGGQQYINLAKPQVTGTGVNGPVHNVTGDGPVILFDGISNYIDGKNVCISANVFSFEVWIRFTSTATNQWIFCEGNSSNTTPIIGLSTDPSLASGKISINYRPTAGGSTNIVTSSSAVNDNKWHHVVGTSDGTTLRLYIDSKVQTTTASITAGAVATDRLGIGALLRLTPGQWFNGQVSIARSYTKCLTSAEVIDLYLNKYGLVRPQRNHIIGDSFVPQQNPSYITGGYYPRKSNISNKPQVGSVLDTSHPLAFKHGWLLNEGAGLRVHNLGSRITNNSSAILVNSSWGQSLRGPILINDASPDRTVLAGDSSQVLPTGACTIVVGYAKRDTVLRNTGAFGVAGSVGTATCGAHLPYGDGVVYWDYGGTTAGSGRLAVSGLSVKDDIWAFTVGPRGMEVWQNGIRKGNTASVVTRTTSTAAYQLGVHNGITTDFCNFYFFYIYHRQLNPDEIRRLTVDSYCMIMPTQSVRAFSIPSTSAPIQNSITGTLSSASSTMSANLVRGENVSGALSASSATTSASLTSGRNVTGTLVSNNSTLTGNIRVGPKVSGSLQSNNSTGTGSLTAGRLITAPLSAARSTMSGVISSGTGFIGTFSSRPATMTGSLTAGRKITSALTAQLSTVSGLLGTGKAVSGSMVASPASFNGSLIRYQINYILATLTARPAIGAAVLTAGKTIIGNMVSQAADIDARIGFPGYTYLLNLGETVFIYRLAQDALLINTVLYDNTTLVKEL